MTLISLFKKWASSRSPDFFSTATAYRIASVPQDAHGLSHGLARHLGGRPFSFLYDFSKNQTALVGFGIEPQRIQQLQAAWPGLLLEPVASPSFDSWPNGFRLDGFPFQQSYVVNDPQSTTAVPSASFVDLKNVLESLCGKAGRLVVGFDPVSLHVLEEQRDEFENLFNTQTTSLQTDLSSSRFRQAHTTTTSIMRHTDRTRVAAEVVSMINEAKTQNDAAYCVSIYGGGLDGVLLKNVLKTSYVHFEENLNETRRAAACFPLSKGELMSAKYASAFIHFLPSHVQPVCVVAVPPLAFGLCDCGMALGSELQCGVRPTGRTIRLHPDALMLHGIVSGLNGMGKTTLAHAVASDLIRQGTPVVVFSPDKEWNALARSHSDVLAVPLYDSIPLNLVRCPDGVPVDLFYQNLALWLSNAMQAGPYSRPLLKTMLAAFARLYDAQRNPSLSQVYDAIVCAANEAYGTKTASGFKYDQYGHNIYSALESIRQLIRKRYYGDARGLCVEDWIQRSVVFDSSELSELHKPLLYAFLFSQIFSYGLTHFDEKARHLRLLICMEEAHLVFKNGSNDGSDVVCDDVQRKMGLLRKRGIGLLFVTHFADQLHSGIRRYAQNKITFRQDVQSLEPVLDDLGFNPNDVRLRNCAKDRLLKMPTFTAAIRLCTPDFQTIGPAFIQARTDFLQPLSNEELLEKTRRLKHFLEQKGRADRVLESLPRIQTTSEKPVDAGFENVSKLLLPALSFQVLFAIGSGTACTASDLAKIPSIGKAYKTAVTALLEGGFVLKNVRRTRTKPSAVFSLTSKGEQAYFSHLHKSPVGLELNFPSHHHEDVLSQIKKRFPNYRPMVLSDSFVRPGSAHQSLGVKPFSSKDRIDLVLECQTAKAASILLFEYEVGTNSNVQLLTNLTKLAHTRTGLQASQTLPLSCVEAFWIAKNQSVKQRLLNLSFQYEQATHEQTGVRIVTLNELLDWKSEKISQEVGVKPTGEIAE